ncbi:MAG: CHASE3 domain-containing protein, partial [Candidatus Woesearchaeota archaeon]
MRGNSRLRGRILVVVAAGALLVAGGVALLLGNTVALRNTAESATRASVYLRHVSSLQGLVLDAETGLRGDVITGRALFLQPLHRAQAQLPAAIGALERTAT